MTQKEQNGEEGGGVAQIPQSEISTVDKKVFLREWARQRSGGDPARLPVTHEARAAIKAHFGDVPGSGLGTDSVSTILRELRAELSRPRVNPASERLLKIAQIAAMMAEEGIREIAISDEGDVVSMIKFSRR